MKIKFSNSELDLEAVSSPKEFFDFLESIPGQTENLIPKTKDKGLSKYEVYDTLLPREQAIMNLVVCMKQSRDSLRERLFPVDVYKTYQMVSMMRQEKNYALPAVDATKFENFTKLNIFTSFAINYLDGMINARLGYGLAYKVASNGKIYALTDLRELHKSSL